MRKALILALLSMFLAGSAFAQGAPVHDTAWARNPYAIPGAQISVCSFGTASISVTGITQALTIATATFTGSAPALIQTGAFILGSGFSVTQYNQTFQVQAVIGNTVLFVVPNGLTFGSAASGTFTFVAAPQGSVCSPTISIYSDLGLSQLITQPLTSDGLGNFSFYVAPGTYQVSICATGLNCTTYTTIPSSVPTMVGTPYNAIALGTVAFPSTGIPNGAVEIFSYLITSPEVSTGYPLGNNLALVSRANANLTLNNTNLGATTTASLAASANTNVLVSAVTETNSGLFGATPIQTGTTALFSIGTVAAPNTIEIGRYTANDEFLTYSATINCPTASTWNIVDATHLCLNTAKTHAGTTDIQQVSNMQWSVGSIGLNCNAVQPSQYASTDWCRMFDSKNKLVLSLPSDITASGNNADIVASVPIVGMAGNVGFQGVFASPNTPLATIGVVRFASADGLCWRNQANGADVCLTKNTNDELTWPNPAVWPGIHNFPGNTAALTADWTCGTGGTVASCVSATIIGSGGGVPLTFTLPLVAQSYTLECDGVVGQATGATANNWNLLTATNGATNVTAFYDMFTAATAKAGGATTDQASTTTTFNIGGTWTLGGTATKMPFHINARIEGASASGTVVSLQLVAPTVGDLVTIYRGATCKIF